MGEPIAVIDCLNASYGGNKVLSDISFTLKVNDCLAIVGPVGSGKTTLAKALSGRLFRTGSVYFKSRSTRIHPSILLVEQQHHFKNRSNMQDFYLQQRFNSADAGDAYTIREELSNEEELPLTFWLDFFILDHLIDKPLVTLSNGENKRLQLVKSVLRDPDWLILDNPFLGLDVEGREILSKCLEKLRENSFPFILINSPEALPACVNQVIYLENGRIAWNGPVSAYESFRKVDTFVLNYTMMDDLITSAKVFEPFQQAIYLRNVSIQYGEKVILSNITWDVKSGDHWALSGPNGAGKSTILSLITADNPQAYAKDLILFDRKRGTGESIWDIKKRIGYVSPELHVYFKEPGNVFNVVGSGLFDTLGVYRKISEDQHKRIALWLGVFGISHLSDRMFQQISTGEQRMVLLARALVKNPPLLILDEPCQGLDEEQILRVKEILNYICSNSQTTLIYVSHYASDIPSCVNQHFKLEASVN
jgi:molybdate transport system ATP-binding protein